MSMGATLIGEDGGSRGARAGSDADNGGGRRALGEGTWFGWEKCLVTGCIGDGGKSHLGELAGRSGDVGGSNGDARGERGEEGDEKLEGPTPAGMGRIVSTQPSPLVSNPTVSSLASPVVSSQTVSTCQKSHRGER